MGPNINSLIIYKSIVRYFKLLEYYTSPPVLSVAEYIVIIFSLLKKYRGKNLLGSLLSLTVVSSY